MRRRLRVVTWNVGRLYSPRHHNRLDDADVPAVARVLGELDPDVALLQELVDVRQLDGIVTRLSQARGGFTAALAHKCQYDRRTAALVRADRAPAFEEHSPGPTGRTAVLA